MDKNTQPNSSPPPTNFAPSPAIEPSPPGPSNLETSHPLLNGLVQKALVAVRGLTNVIRGPRKSNEASAGPKKHASELPAWMTAPVTEFHIPQQETTPMRTMAKAPSFADLVHEAEVGTRSKEGIAYWPAKLDPGSERSAMDDLATADEGELILDLDRFLARAEEAAEYTGDYRALTSIKRNRADLPFLGEAEFEASTQGIANDWQEYLREDPNRKIFLYYPLGSKNKSNTFVSDAILKKAATEEFNGRVMPLRISGYADLPDTLKNANVNDVRIVLADDWIGEGTQMSRAMGVLAQDLISRHRGDLISTIEMDLLLANDAQADYGMSFQRGQNQIRVKSLAYYVSPGDLGPLNISSFGRHGSNDRNYQTFDTLGIMIQRYTNSAVDLPKAAYIQPPYKQVVPSDKSGN